MTRNDPPGPRHGCGSGGCTAYRHPDYGADLTTTRRMHRRRIDVDEVEEHHPMTGGRAALVVVAVAAAVLLVAPALTTHAAPSITTAHRSVSVVTDEQGVGSSSLTLSIASDVSGTITPVFEDVVLSEQGQWEPLELGTTPYSLQPGVQARPATIRYAGDDVGARVDLQITVEVDDARLDLPRAGLVALRFEPDDDSDDASTAPVRVRVGAWPASLDTEPVTVELGELSLSTVSPWPGLDRLLPDLPRVINRGEVSMSVATRNTGDALTHAQTTLTLTRWGPQAARSRAEDDGGELVTLEAPDQLLLPGESSTSHLDGAQLEDLPIIGLVRLGATATGELGANGDAATLTRTYLVAPWKEGLAVTLALGLLAAAGWRVRSRLAPPEPAAAPPTSDDPPTLDDPPPPTSADPPTPPADPPTLDDPPPPTSADPPTPPDDPPTSDDPPTPPAADPPTPPAADPPTPPATDPPDASHTEAKQIVAEILARIEADRAHRRGSDTDPPSEHPEDQPEPGT